MNLYSLDNAERKAIIGNLKNKYPVGKRVELVDTSKDNPSIASGMQGTVKKLYKDGSIRVNWDNGTSSTVEYGTDDLITLN